ncbi:putative GMC oxidoreductase [Podospora fimiseda]|uniref:GMC oxidoreductase n=1 Tax=Podospora fimiseda TaxID=252190 RepID=A0AAN7BGV8_9PEZI|nr:putative GMC oxidoreductase [Podospora fimiseda]
MRKYIFLTFQLVALLGVTVATNSQHNNDGLDGTTYDYIIVGSGPAGLVLANRLTENRRTTVLVIERGYFDDKPEAYIPYYAQGVDFTQTISPRSAPILKLNNSTRSDTVAAVVGGASLIHGLAGIRGTKVDYDAWEKLGNPGWGWKGILLYFKKSLSFTPPRPETIRRWNITWDPSVYGKGPLQLHISDFQYPGVVTFWDAIRNQPGSTVGLDINAGEGPGGYWTITTIDARNQTRYTARSAYYDPVHKTRPNLKLVTGQTATKILFSRSKPLTANGIQIVSRLDKRTRNVYAKKEVVLSAGAVMTPHLLQVSGIGPASVLKAAGSRYCNLNSAQSFPNPDSLANNATLYAESCAEYLANKTGPISTVNGNTFISYSPPQVLGSNVTAQAVASRLLAQNPTHFLPSSYSKNTAMLKGFLAQRAILVTRFTSNTSFFTASPFRGNGFSPSPPLKSLSRGEITLNLTHPSALPVVQYNTFQNPIDEENVVAIVRRSRRFWQSPQMDPLGPIVELSPGPQFQTNEEILGELRRNELLFWPSLAHPSGTCAMMPQKLGGCVDSKLRVYEVKGLRVVDASIIPLIIGTSLQPTVYAIAEKAADIIKQG